MLRDQYHQGFGNAYRAPCPTFVQWMYRGPSTVDAYHGRGKGRVEGPTPYPLFMASEG